MASHRPLPIHWAPVATVHVHPQTPSSLPSLAIIILCGGSLLFQRRVLVEVRAKSLIHQRGALRCKSNPPPHPPSPPLTCLLLAIHGIQRVQCAIVVRLAVQSTHAQLGPLLPPPPSPPPYLSLYPSLLTRVGCWGSLAAFTYYFFVPASAFPITVLPLLGHFFMGGVCSDLGNLDPCPLAPFPAVANPIQPQPVFWLYLFFVFW